MGLISSTAKPSHGRPRWGKLRRFAAATAGALFIALSVVLTLSIYAQGESADRIGLAIASMVFYIGPAGLILLASSLWGGWSPPSTAIRVRSIRAAASWVVVVGLFMLLSLPLPMTGDAGAPERRAYLVLLVLLSLTILGAASIRRWPRVGVGMLSVAGAYVALRILGLTLNADVASSLALVGPHAAWSILVAASGGAMIVGAAILAWPLHSARGDDPG